MFSDAATLDSSIYYLLWAVVWLAPGLVTALIASDKGRSVWLWLVLGVVFSWLALVAIIFLPGEQRSEGEATDEHLSPQTGDQRQTETEDRQATGTEAEDQQQRETENPQAYGAQTEGQRQGQDRRPGAT